MCRKKDWRWITVVQVDFPVLQWCTSNSVFSSRTNGKFLWKINELEFEINWFGQIHPTMVKAKGDTNPYEPQFNFSFEKKANTNNNANHIMQVRFQWLHKHKTIAPKKWKFFFSRKSSCLNWGNGKSDIQPNCCSFLFFLHHRVVNGHFKWTLKN